MRFPTRKAARAIALLTAFSVMLASLAPPAARAQGGPAPVIVRDAETEGLVIGLVNPLLRAAGVDPGLVRIVIVQARAINAFVTTGNRLFINTGLIQQSATVGDLAGVLAHEVGHIAGGHIARLPEELRNAMISTLAAMLLGGAAAVAGGGRGVGASHAAAGIMLGGQAMAMNQLYAFTRAQEQAADQAGVAVMERLGWSARGLARILERLQDQELLAVGRQDPYFRTHPLSTDRLAFVREHVARSRFSDRPWDPALETSFRMVRAKLDGFLDPPLATWRRYPESDASAPARYARAIAQYRSARPDVAVGLLEALIREQPANPWLHEMKGQILFEAGRPREAVEPYRQAVRLAPRAATIRTALGRALMEGAEAEGAGGAAVRAGHGDAGRRTADLRAAVAEFESALSIERDSAFVWRQLGTALGRLGRMAEADLALAEEALLEQDWPAVRLLARRAAAALPPGPKRLRAEDLRVAAQRDNMTREERQIDDALRRQRR